MKKLMALLTIVLLALSMIPFAFAESGSSSEGLESDDDSQDIVKIEEKTEIRMESDDSNVRERMRITSEMKDGELRERVELRKDVRMMDADPTLSEEERLKLKEEIRSRFEMKREANIEKLRDLDPEKLQRLEALGKFEMERIANLDAERMKKIAELDTEAAKKFAELTRAEQDKLSRLDAKKLALELKEVKIKEVRSAEDLKERIIARQKIDEARMKFKEASEKFDEARADYKEARLKLKDSATEEERLEHAKTVLTRAAESIITHLEKIKARALDNENLAEEREKEIVSAIDAHIATVSALKEKAAAATTMDEVKLIAKELRGAWKDMEIKARSFAERVITARVEGALNQGLVLEKRLDSVLAKLKEQGVEVELEAEVTAFSASITTAKDKFESAQDKLGEAQSATSADTKKRLVSEANALLKQSKDALKAAHEQLRVIIKKIRDAGAEVELDDGPVDVVEIEDDSDDESEESTEDESSDDSSESADSDDSAEDDETA